METIKTTTKRGARFFSMYNNSRLYSLRDCYGRYSNAKAAAENACYRSMLSEGGRGFKIISYNTFGFSCAWETAAGLRIETPARSILVI